MNRPAISVVMATYNGAGLVDATIRSVLCQSFADFELVIFDDASTDNTLEVVNSFSDARIRVLGTGCNMGPVGARNRAVAAARGRYLAALDQDDLCLPERFAQQIDYMEKHPDVVVLGTAARRLIDGKLYADHLPRRTTPMFLWWLLHVMNPLVWSTVMIRTSAARDLPIFSRVERQYAEDYDLYHRLAAAGKIARLDAVLLTYRSHNAGASHQREAQMSASAVAVLAAIYLPWLGEASTAAAWLMTHYISRRLPPPSFASAFDVCRILTGVCRRFYAANDVDLETDRLISAETRRLKRRLFASTLRQKVRVSFGSQIVPRSTRPPDVPGLSRRDPARHYTDSH